VSILGRLLERRDFAGYDGWRWSPYLDGTIPPPGVDEAGGPAGLTPANEANTLGLIDAYACVTLLADSASMLPVDGFMRSTEARVQLSPQPKLLAQPDDEIEGWEWRYRAVMSLALRGNAYAVITDRDRLGVPLNAPLVHPDDIEPLRDRNSGAKVFRLRTGETLAARDVIHIPLASLPGALKGLSPIGCARRGIGLSIATESYGARYFVDSANPSSVLESDQALRDSEVEDVQRRWIRSHGGRRRPAVLTGGLKWRAISIKPEESQFLQTRKLQTAQIARLFRVPPHMIGDVERSTSWGSGIEEQGIGFVVFTMGPYLARIEAALTRQLPRPQYAKFNVAALLRGNTRDRFIAYAIARQWGWLSANDIRRLEDLPPIPDGDVYLQPLNMIDAEQALKVLLQPSGAGGAPGASS
jgi:HK97 family phage portal protein